MDSVSFSSSGCWPGLLGFRPSMHDMLQFIGHIWAPTFLKHVGTKNSERMEAQSRTIIIQQYFRSLWPRNSGAQAPLDTNAFSKREFGALPHGFFPFAKQIEKKAIQVTRHLSDCLDDDYLGRNPWGAQFPRGADFGGLALSSCQQFVRPRWWKPEMVDSEDAAPGDQARIQAAKFKKRLVFPSSLWGNETPRHFWRTPHFLTGYQPKGEARQTILGVGWWMLAGYHSDRWNEASTPFLSPLHLGASAAVIWTIHGRQGQSRRLGSGVCLSLCWLGRSRSRMFEPPAQNLQKSERGQVVHISQTWHGTTNTAWWRVQ